MMTIKEQLISEIKERIALQKDLLKRAEDSARIEGSIDALMGLLNSMDTLSEEPDKSLEEAAEKYRRKTCNEACKNSFLDNHPSPSIKTAFIVGAKWMEKEINKELIKAAEKVHEIRDVDYDIHVDTSAIDSFETTSYYENGKLVGQDRSKKED